MESNIAWLILRKNFIWKLPLKMCKVTMISLHTMPGCLSQIFHLKMSTKSVIIVIVFLLKV